MKIISDNKINIEPGVHQFRNVTGYNLIADLNKVILATDIKVTSLLILIDKTVYSLIGAKLKASLEKLNKKVRLSVINTNETQKDIINIPDIVKPFFNDRFDRHSCLISVGGGVVTDIGGFISAILFRGLNSIFIPTTLLAQIDAAIGGKNGVNLNLGKGKMLKNMFGTFKQPDLIISDVKILKTLPDKELINGLGEMVKYHIGWGIPSENELFKFVNLIKSNNWDQASKIIAKCQNIKMKIVDMDPFERTEIRQKLNLGHTIGHAIEAVSDGKLSHGQAVGLGLIATAKISVLKSLLNINQYLKIQNLIKKLGLSTSIKNIDKKKVLSVLTFDKKGGSFVLIKDIGKLVTNCEVEKYIIKQVINEVII